MLDSNFYILKFYRLSISERDKRIMYLENTLKQLQDYHIKAKPAKRPTIAKLICAYDELLESFNRR